MLRRTCLVAILAASWIPLTGAAQAQDVGIGFYTGYGPYEYGPSYYYRPPAYSYAPAPTTTYRYAPPVVMERARPASCGEFHYWTGSRCADARVTPPNID